MKKRNVWIVPCVFFLVACILNLSGRLCCEPLAQTVKPSLLPLLAVTTLAYLISREGVDLRAASLLATAQLFGFAGDTLLIGNGFPMFAGGMAAFLVGHIFYMCLFGGRSWKGLRPMQWVLSLIVMAAIVAVLVVLIGIKGVMLAPMSVYAMGLMLLIFTGLCGVVRKEEALRSDRRTWWIILLGGLLFTFSDSQIAMDTFGVLPFEGRGFVIMLTYLAAQALLAVGGIRLALRRQKA